MRSIGAVASSILFALITAACVTSISTTLNGAWLSDDRLNHYTFNEDGSVEALANVGDPVHGGGIIFPIMTWHTVGPNQFEITSRWWEGDAPQVRHVVRRGNRLVDAEGRTWLTRAD